MTNMRFADALAEEEVVGDKNYTMYRKKLNAEKTKLIIYNTYVNDIQRQIMVKRQKQKLGTVTSFKYLEAVVSDNSFNQRLSRISKATAALTKLMPIWRDNYIALGSNVKLMRSLVVYIFLCLDNKLEKRTQDWR